MTTIRDVAREAGVSVATVSRFLNKSGYVGEESQKKILSAVNKLNYVPNEIARSLNRQSSNIIGLLVPDITNPYFPALIKGAEQCATQHGYVLILGNTEGENAIATSYLNFFKQYKVAGIIKADGNPHFSAEGIPTVAVDRKNDHDLFAVVADDFYGGQLVAQTIAKTSYRSIVIISGPQELSVSQQRLRGIQSLFNHEKIPYQIEFIPSYQMEFADQIAQDIIKCYPQTDTFIAPNDIYALALIQAIHQKGLNIPTDVQIIGYDGIVFGSYSQPSLTSIQQPAYEIGYQGMNLLLSLIHRTIDTAKPLTIQIKPQLINRNSLREGPSW